MSVTKARILRLVSALDDERAFQDFLGLAADTISEKSVRSALKALWEFMQGRGITRHLDKDNVLFAREVVGHFSPEHALRFALELNRDDRFYYHVRKERLIISILNTHKMLSGQSLRRVVPVSAGEIVKTPTDAQADEEFLACALKTSKTNIHVVPKARHGRRSLEDAVPEPPVDPDRVRAFIPIDRTIYRLPEYMIFEDVSVSTSPTGLCHGALREVMNYVYEQSDQYHHFRIFGRTPDRRVGDIVPQAVVLPRYGMSDNYYHALIDRVAALHFGAQFDGRIPVFSSFPLGELERRMCSALEIPAENVIYVEGLSHVARRGIVPFMQAARPYFYKYCQKMARKRLRQSAERFGDRIYISRLGANARRLLNEEEVIARVEAAGFRVLQFERMSIEQQMAAMAGAEVVLAPHGAGLANLVFCQSGTRVVEMLSEDYPNASFRQLAYDCNLRYTLLLGRKRERDTWEMPLDMLDMVLQQLPAPSGSSDTDELQVAGATLETG